ncbi:MAG: penicillin-binding protein [Candidatus Synechococcus spongiarum SP3]|uniref:Penicillin-binding protein n=1 Tax=Candidatus Synechococcus spongiarum SP3 TaxID=1604020 RepID=A0A0G2HJD9_9SYNE|nr:MAG: penicillin-binding protein [Candidatus Synechococcus spongiarum SP3]
MIGATPMEEEPLRQVGLGQGKHGLLLQLLLALVLVLSGRLFWLQIVQGEQNRVRSRENSVRVAPSQPIRGQMLDRHGEVLVSSHLVHKLYVWPKQANGPDWRQLRHRLSTLLDVPEEDLEKRRASFRAGDYRIALTDVLTPAQTIKLLEQADELPGAEVGVDYLRAYPHGMTAAHALGYTSPITDEELSHLTGQGYQIQDRIGRTGLEAAYEQHLRGQWGGRTLEVSANGDVQRPLGEKPSVPGKDLTLTLDLALQQAAEKAIAKYPVGAVVAMDPRDGAILAMVSRPAYDPNFFSQPVKPQTQLDALFRSSALPMLNRALNPYNPGSVFKVVTAAAGMESGMFPPETTLHTTACMVYGSHCFPDHNGEGFGNIGYEDALRFSSNTFFYQVGVGSGSMELYDAAVKLGFTQHSGIEIGFEEDPGLVGNEEWAAAGRGWAEPGQTPWIPEDMASASIGQSVVQVSPMQVARAYAAIANGGWLVRPHLSSLNPQTGEPVDWLSQRQPVAFAPETWTTLQRGLRKVVADGTGYGMNSETLPHVSGKTGTAEDNSSHGEDHAWFASYAPSDNPEVVVVAFAANSPGGGSVHGLPIAKAVMEAYFNP